MGIGRLPALAAWALMGLAIPLDMPLAAETADAAFLARADAAYRRDLDALKAGGFLDQDRELLDRARAVMVRLVAPAAGLRPDSRGWAWELHVSSKPGASAYCIAGGKMIVGATFVRRLALSDAELAMLLAHEMAHALAGHRMPAPRDSTESDPAGELVAIQRALAIEEEADRLGMRLAASAGFPPGELAVFYDKVASLEPAGTFNASHPPAIERAERAHRLAAELGRPQQ